jgi:hypothetical protein
MSQVWKNYCKGVLTAGITNVATFLTITAGATSEAFPTTGQFKVVLWDLAKDAPLTDADREIMTLEWNSGESRFDIVGRGEEGTIAKAWAEGSNIAHILTAEDLAGFDAKQDALGYTPENVANKKTTLTDSDTDYPTTKAVNTGLSGKEDSLGYTPENIANKKTDLADNSDTYYPSQKAVKSAVDAKVAGPASAVDENISVFDSITGKIIKDSGYNKSILDALNTPLSDEGLILYLPFDENTGTTAYDKSHNGNNGTFKGAGEPAWSEGHRNVGVDFDGIDDYVALSQIGEIIVAGTYSICMWFKFDTVNADRALFSQTISGSDRMSIMVRGSSGKVVAGHYNGAAWQGLLNTDSAINAGEWHHFVYTYNNGVGKLYLNGIEQTGTGEGVLTTSTAGTKIGSRSDGGAYFMDGKIDEVRTFSRALSANEVMAWYLKGDGGG